MECRKRVWEFRFNSDSQDKFRECLESAQTCKHFEKRIESI